MIIVYVQDIGEEFVEFLEKELNISDDEGVREKDRSPKAKASNSTGTKAPPRKEEPKAAKNEKIENELDEIEDMLAKLKKEMGR